MNTEIRKEERIKELESKPFLSPTDIAELKELKFGQFKDIKADRFKHSNRVAPQIGNRWKQ